MKQKDFEKWEKIRTKGKLHFILTRGVFGCGILFTLLWSICMALLRGKEDFLQSFVEYIIYYFFIFLLIGGYLCIHIWNYQEKKYLDFISEKNNTFTQNH